MSENQETPFSGLDNNKRYRAKISPVIKFPGDDSEPVEVVSTTNSPDSSYGFQCWVDADGHSYGQITLNNPMYEVFDVEEITDEQADAWLDS